MSFTRAAFKTGAYLAAGSLAGGFSRFGLSAAIFRAAGASFPYGTFAVNALGCFLAGLFESLAAERLALGPQARVLLVTGFCGAFTTFSALILETSNLMKNGDFGRAALNVAGSVLVGLIAFRIGALTGRLL